MNTTRRRILTAVAAIVLVAAPALSAGPAHAFDRFGGVLGIGIARAIGAMDVPAKEPAPAPAPETERSGTPVAEDAGKPDAAPAPAPAARPLMASRAF